MKETYIIRDPENEGLAAAIADVVLMPTRGPRRRYYVVTNIRVMDKYRGQGYGSKVLNLICEDADRENVTLFLEPVASDGLTQKELVAWYERHGFDWGTWHMRRKPG